MTGVLAALAASRLPKGAKFIGSVVITGGNGTVALPTGTAVGDLVLVFGPYGGTVTGGGTGTWLSQSYASAQYGYTNIFAQKKLASLGSVTVSGASYGPIVVAVYRDCSFAGVIAKPQENTATYALTDVVGRLPKSRGYVSFVTDRNGNGDATKPVGWTERTGPNATGVFTGELADLLTVRDIPNGPYSASWTGLSTGYEQTGWFVHLTDYASQSEYDAAASAANYDRADSIVLFRMAVQPDANRQALIRDTVNNLKAAGIWAKLDAFYCMAAHTDQAARINWVKPQFDLTNYNAAPSFGANLGFATNGSTTALDTGFIPTAHAVKMTQNSACMFVRHRTNSQNAYFDAGWAFNSNPTILLGTRNASDKLTYAMNSSAAQTSVVSITDARKVIAVNRPNNLQQLLYVDAVVVENAGVGSTGLMSNGSLKIGATLGNRFSGRQFSFFGFGASLTEAQHEALRDIIENYMAEVGA